MQIGSEECPWCRDVTHLAGPPPMDVVSPRPRFLPLRPAHLALTPTNNTINTQVLYMKNPYSSFALSPRSLTDPLYRDLTIILAPLHLSCYNKISQWMTTPLKLSG